MSEIRGPVSAGAVATNPVQGAVANSEQPTQAVTTVDPKLDLYMRKERELAKKRKEFDDERRAWEAEKSSKYVQKDRFKLDPVAALQDVDLDYDKLTETILSQPNLNDPTIRALKSQLDELREQQLKMNQTEQEREQARAEQGKTQRLNEIKLATHGQDDFELIEMFDAHDAVSAIMDETLERDGIQMSVGEACKAVESQLLPLAQKLINSKKLKPAEAPAVQQQNPSAASEDKPKWKNPMGYSVNESARNRINTLTNRMTQETPKQSSVQDRIQRAIAIARGELK